MILLQSQKRGDTMNELYNTGKDIKALIESLTPEEKKQALAMLMGMKCGKELAAEQDKKTA